jgi:hypothetical protein
MSRRPYQPTPEVRRQVLTMTELGLTQANISGLLEIDRKTLRKHFRYELDTGAITANMKVAASLFQMATVDKVPAAAIFWMKARAGWKEKQDLTIDGTQTVQLQHLVAAKAFSDQIHSQFIEAKAEPAKDEPGELLDLMQPALE